MLQVTDSTQVKLTALGTAAAYSAWLKRNPPQLQAILQIFGQFLSVSESCEVDREKMSTG